MYHVVATDPSNEQPGRPSLTNHVRPILTTLLDDPNSQPPYHQKQIDDANLSPIGTHMA